MRRSFEAAKGESSETGGAACQLSVGRVSGCLVRHWGSIELKLGWLAPGNFG